MPDLSGVLVGNIPSDILQQGLAGFGIRVISTNISIVANDVDRQGWWWRLGPGR
jgi:hypothetical protein